MPLSKNLSAYAHIKQILDAALSHPKLIWTLPSKKAAIRWRQEAYYYRKLSGNPLYDNYILRIEDANVIIERREVVGVLKTPEGKEIAPATPDLGADLTGMERAAFNLAQTLGLQFDDDQDT
jgi:hypothetical protein